MNKHSDTNHVSFGKVIHQALGSLTVAIIAILLVISIGALPSSAHPGSDFISIYSPLSDGDSVYSDITAKWASTVGTEPATHHVVFSNWGYMNDWSVDIFGPPGRIIVSPFGTKTSSSHAVIVKVVGLRVGCASGLVADGGYRITLEARDTVTGLVVGRADLMHVNSPRVRVGQGVGPWTPLGSTSRFRYSSCYQVTSDSGVHTHLEMINYHRYACYVSRSNGASLTELTIIGKVGAHYSARRSRC